ncbi:inositol monophosphatase family protein [Rarobacter faecitabidus]|nr:inositol monophosphatase family protein [Rarobacter faecitabidus]
MSVTHENLDPADIEALAALARTVAVRAGDHIRRNSTDAVEVAATKSSQTDVVTAMDREVEGLLREWILAARPDDGFLGEEDGSVAGTSGLTWVLDPIDGTVNYLYGLDSYAVSVAVVSGEPDPLHWTAVAGAVHDVPRERTWWAGLGRGAWYGERRLTIPPAQPLGFALVGTGFGYDERRRRVQAEVLLDVLPRVRDIRRIGSAALDLCRVAAGQLDAMFERGQQPWDHAAGGLVVTEAGGVVVGIDGAAPSADMLIAGPAETVESLRSILAVADATRPDIDV